MKKRQVLVAVLSGMVVLLIVGLVVQPPGSTMAKGVTPSVYFMPIIEKHSTFTPTVTPTPTPTPTPVPCQVQDTGWSKRPNWVDIIFWVQGADMRVSFKIHYRSGSREITRYVGGRTLTKGEKRYSYNDGLSTAWQPFDIEFVKTSCIEDESR